MMKKKIKTFTVDEDAYDALVAMFKQYESETSVSYYVNRCLLDLLEYLNTLDRLRKNDIDKYSVPMSFAIDSVVKEPKLKVLKVESGSGYAPGHDELEEIQIRYEAEQNRIPARFWRFLRTGKFHLSADNRYLIDNETSRAYKPTEWGTAEEVPDRDEETGNRTGHGDIH